MPKTRQEEWREQLGLLSAVSFLALLPAGLLPTVT